MKNVSLFLFTAMLTIIGTPVLASTNIIGVSNVDELADAIRIANSKPLSENTTIAWNGPITVPPETDLPVIESNVTIGGSLRAFDSTGPKRLFKIGTSGVVKLHLRISDFTVSSEDVKGLIENNGQLYFKGRFSRVRNLVSCQRWGCEINETPIVYNGESGDLRMELSLFSEDGYSSPAIPVAIFFENYGTATLKQVQIYLPGDNWKTPIYNHGNLRLINVTMINQPGLHAIGLNRAIATTSGAVSETVNSIFGGFSGEWCSGTISLGHNLIDATDCSWNGEGDLTGTRAGVIWRDSAVTSRPHTGNALVPTRVSAAVDSAASYWCPYLGESYDGNGDGRVGCDRGAVELRPAGLTGDDGGINGLYFNPEADGHYVQILQTDYTTVVTWNTFDEDGKPFWVYGMGELIDGSTVVADTYVHENDGKFDFNENPPSDAVFWGTIEVDMASCNDGDVAYASSYPGFGEGSFPIKRLGYVKQLGCVD